MTGSESKFDPEILQARWVLGGLNAEELVDCALLALQQGFSGTALQQLARLTHATQRDLENLPAKAFAEMGLNPIGKDQAVTFLISRGEPKTCGSVTALLDAFPSFSGRWRKHIQFWGGMPAGCYNDMSEFVRFILDDLYEGEDFGGVRRAFKLLDKLYVEGNEETKNLIALGFFETLQCAASWRPYGKKAFEQFLEPTSMEVWREIQQLWVGKSSLADVIRAERKHRKELSGKRNR